MFLRSVEGLSSPDFFAAFQRRAGFVIKSPFLTNEYSERERAMLDAISQLPKGDYSANLRQLKTTYPLNQLDELVQKVMRAAEGRKSLASTVGDSRSSSLSSIQGGSVSSEEGVVSPRLRTKMNPVVGEPEKRRDLPPPPRLAQTLPSAVSPRGRRDTPPPIKKAPPPPPPQNKGEVLPRPAAARLKERRPPPVPTREKAATPPPEPVHRSTPLRRALSPDPRRTPMKKQKSFIETGSAVDLLKIQREYEIALQGAVCLKFLFPEAYAHLFPKEEDRKIVDAIIRIHGTIRFVGASRERAVDEVFKQAPKNLFSVLHRLGRQQTAPHTGKAPSLRDFPPLAPIFFRDPRLAGKHLESLVELMGKIRYQCLGIYTAMPESLRRGLNCFCAAVFIQEMTGWPLRDCLQVSFRGKYPTEAELDRLVREVTLSDFLKPVEMPPEAPIPQKSVEEVFAYPFLKYPVLFRLLLKHVALFKPEERRLFFGKQIEAVHTLKGEALLSHEEAVRRCFAKSALEKHFAGEDRLAEKTLAELDRLSPHPSYDHPLLKTAEGIAQLRETCQGDLQGYFKRVQDVMKENPGMAPFLAVQAVFHRSALRLFFESDRDSENGRELDRLIEERTKNLSAFRGDRV